MDTSSLPLPALRQRPLAAPLRTIYGICAWLVFLLLALGAVLVLLLLPGLDLRRRVTHWVARSYLRLSATSLEVNGLEMLPAGPCIVVVNHESYIDGLVVKAALPPRFAFVIKREMATVPLAGLLLRRIGSHFVERSDRHKGASDARRVLRSAASGASLVFFPEGTFAREPGLLKFHAGAFATAARSGLPLVTAVLSGTRHALPPGALLPRPARLRLAILRVDPVEALNGQEQRQRLSERSRQLMLEALGAKDGAAKAA
ncbi:MAG: lysophospholipid acyltransferase family protein [Steroidobacteraceae bacterium]